MAGRAHTDDTEAKQTLKTIIGYMQQELAGHAIFIPNYDIESAQALVKGVDLWLNTPVKGMEASGTSGMKAAANGIIQCTVEDGWTDEVDWYQLGWTLDTNNVAESLYLRLADDIVPEFYHRDSNNLPQNWISKMQRTILLSNTYSAKRMMAEYQQKLYSI